jgi:hypothetical protein
MATRQLLIDDLDGQTEASETVVYAIDGQHYAIDLSDGNAKQLRDALAKYNKVARQITSKEALRGAGDGNAVDYAAIRSWAKGQGIEVNPKGRISAEIVAQYQAAQQPTA